MHAKRVVLYIESKLKELDEKEKINSKINSGDRSMSAVLSMIHTLLLKNQNETNMDAVVEAILYLQHIPISRFFGGVALLGDILKADDKPTLRDHDHSSAFDIVLPNAHQKTVASIHVALMAYFLKYKHSVWKYSYHAIQQPVSNSTIKEWQNSQMQVSMSGHQAAYRDFMRDLMIMKQCGGNQHDVTLRINKLVESAAYATNDSELLKKWLAENGGQTNLGFILQSVINHEFTDNDNDSMPRVAYSSNVNGNWYVDDQGKITLCYGFSAHAISYDSGELIVTTRDSKIAKISDPHAVQSELERYEKLKKSGMSMPDLLNFEIEIQLDIIGGTVVPQVVFYEVVSFTDILKSPARLYGHDHVEPEVCSRHSI